ncbi:MAG: oligosaccharide flippase family protein [Candidatus Kaelpia imicola]|nr:oligosaccharide flippase family protein [Candidatus Kaelpia imicola]
MINKIKVVFKKQQLYSQATILFLAASVGNFFSLLYHLFMVRALSPQDYGVMSTLFACIMFFAMPTGNLQITLTRFVARYHGMGSKSAIVRLLKGISGRIFILGAIIAAVIFVGARSIAGYLHIDNLMPVYSMAGVVMASLLLPVTMAGLQGLQHFLSLGLSMICMNVGKLILAVAFVLLGFGVTGALNSLTAGVLIGAVIAFAILKSSIRKIDFEKDTNVDVSFKEIYLYILPVSLAMLSFVMLTHLDLILVKHFFTPLEAGYYSIAQMIGKMVLFLPAAICMVMLPKVANSHAKEEETIHHLKHSTLYIVVLVIFAASVIIIFPELMVKLFTGKVYPQCYNLVRLFAVSMGFFAICFNFLLYYLSLNRIKFMIPFLIVLVLEAGLIYFWHNSLSQILGIVIAAAFVLFLANVVIIKKNFT